ncbi:DM13 domain-containing protein [Hoyosella sp. G463]|uniref:DM13 domain-containing protein n=1 Tax=Lolliginicoccus lacisalsi TaxID=2742202 RepID=A0A927J9C6_9ACTN|nr:DM13 domain-containing protein [Lolliginicoccus lacisalsi]MBD8504988.1 DM13 domain-containing protein [Lolliginicoccus lacisalsi]
MANRRRPSRRPILLAIAAILLVLLVVLLYLFQPWKLFVDETVDEAAPFTAATTTAATTTAPAAPGSPETDPPAPARTEPRMIARGTFISHEHATSGSVVIYESPDGSRVLRIEDLRTSNGPDLKVWLTDAPVIEGFAGWGVFDDGQYVDLGALKGNIGSQNYEIPPDADLTELTSVSVWCARFRVSFGAAELLPV